MSFIKDSMKEFDHIVWPTTQETKKYFAIVVSMITLLTVLLFIVGTALSSWLFSIKSHMPTTVAPAASTKTPDLDINNLKLGTTPSTPAATDVKPETATAEVPKK